jgi:hypothetical protein
MTGHPKPFGKHRHNEWTSDHRSVLIAFTVRGN